MEQKIKEIRRQLDQIRSMLNGHLTQLDQLEVFLTRFNRVVFIAIVILIVSTLDVIATGNALQSWFFEWQEFMFEELEPLEQHHQK